MSLLWNLQYWLSWPVFRFYGTLCMWSILETFMILHVIYKQASDDYFNLDQTWHEGKETFGHLYSDAYDIFAHNIIIMGKRRSKDEGKVKPFSTACSHANYAIMFNIVKSKKQTRTADDVPGRFCCKLCKARLAARRCTLVSPKYFLSNGIKALRLLIGYRCLSLEGEKPRLLYIHSS